MTKFAYRKLLRILIVLFAVPGCTPMIKSNRADRPLLVRILRKLPPGPARTVMENAEKHRLQILYTQIDRDAQNRPHFTPHGFRLSGEDYFYPASSVKMATAFLALEKLNRLNIPGLDKYTPLRIDSAFSGQTAVTIDPTAPDSLPTIAHYIKKIFLVSDNDAYNRLFEFLGQRYLNETLWQKGFGDVRIIRRLEVGMSPEENAATNPFTFYRGEQIIYQQPLVRNAEVMHLSGMRDLWQGKGHIAGGRPVPEPIDFSHSNYISLVSLQGILRLVMFPESVPPEQRFNLAPEDYDFLYRYMSMLPEESDIPAYRNSGGNPDDPGRSLFLNPKNFPDRTLLIFNKTGGAYGYLLDNAYVVDFENQIEFFLTAVVQVNENEIYNDNIYEYEQSGYPFLRALGQAIYEYEAERKRAVAPDLTRWARYGPAKKESSGEN